jgi:hypothetical protein
MSLTSRVDPQQNAPKDVMAAVKLAIDRRELFICGQLAAGLARLPGRLEFEEAEAYRILHQITVWYARGEFAADEVLVIFGEPPQLRPLREIEEQGAKISTFEWREGIMLTRAACKRYLERSTLQGAPRLIREWFSIPTSGGLQGAADVTKAPEQGPHTKARRPRRDEKRSKIVVAVNALAQSKRWQESRDKERCQLVDLHLGWPKGSCKLSTLRRAVYAIQNR